MKSASSGTGMSLALVKGDYEDFSGYIIWGDTEAFVEHATFRLIDKPRISGIVFGGKISLVHRVIWDDGTWIDGVWGDGTWNGGIWKYGTWMNGVWAGGTWMDGVFERGEWWNGEWHGGHFDGWWRKGVVHRNGATIATRSKPQ